MDDKTPVGIHNYGWNCFINSLLQSLSCSKELLTLLKHFDKSDNDILCIIKKYNLKFSNNNEDLVNNCNHLINKSQKNNSISKNDIDVIELIKSKHIKLYSYLSFKNIIGLLNNNNNQTLDPSHFIEISKVSNDNTQYSHLFEGSQGDPFEFMQYIFDIIEDSKGQVVTISYNKLEENCMENRIVNLYKNNIKTIYSKTYSKYVEKFIFHNISIISCHQCNHKLLNVSPYNSLALPIPNQKSVSLFDCLNNYLKVETFDKQNTVKCEKCSNTFNNIIEKKILNIKNTVIIQFNRFEINRFGIKKNNTLIDYPLYLNLANYVLMDSNNTNNNYELFSIILHNGSMNNGHYRSIIKKYDDDGNSNWYLCDDDDVRIINENDILNHKNAYILFYQC